MKMNISSYILEFIFDFLNKREFNVSIGDSLSESGEILCSILSHKVLGNKPNRINYEEVYGKSCGVVV